MSTLVNKGETGVDFAEASIPLGRLAVVMGNLHYSFVVRYISTNSKKNLTPAERDIYHLAGIKILLVWEVSATSPVQGASLGAAHGMNARAQAFTLGYPADVCILCAFDTDVFWGNIVACEAYGRAFADAIKPYFFGVYGDADILIRLQDICKLGWLPNARAWSSAARQYALNLGLVHVFQNSTITQFGCTWDTNSCIKAFEAWGPPQVPVQPTAPPVAQGKPSAADAAAASFQGEQDVVYVAVDSGTPNVAQGPQRWLWNGFVMRKVPSEHQADLTNVCFKPSNTIQTPVLMSAADIASFFEV